MDKVNVNTKASVAARAEVSVSFSSNVKIAYEPSIPGPLTSFTLTGPLGSGKYLAHPLEVRIAYDDDEIVVSEPQFHIHAVGANIAEALAEFRLILSEELDELNSDEEQLGPILQAELQYLRALIRTA